MKFERPVEPGDQLVMDVELLRQLGLEVRPVPILEGVSSSLVRELVHRILQRLHLPFELTPLATNAVQLLLLLPDARVLRPRGGGVAREEESQRDEDSPTS